MALFQLISHTLGVPALNILLQSIFNLYLIDSFCITLVTEEPIDLNFNVTFTYITPKMTSEELKRQLLAVSENRCSDYVVNMKNPQLFMTALDLVSKAGNIRRSDRKIIFLPRTDYTDNARNNCLELFSMRETDFVANVLVIAPNVQSDSPCIIYDLVTHTFGTLYGNQPLYLDQWDSCTKKIKRNANLFPHDMKNLQGKLIKVACFHYKPYIILDSESMAPMERDGIEIRIVDEFCRWINCTIEIIREDKEQWGEVLQNGTGLGVIGSVVEDRADIGVSGIYSWYDVIIYSDFSASMTRSSVTCVMPAPRLLESSWTMPLMPFSWYMWCAVLITFVIASIGLAVAKKFSTDGVFLIVFGVMISQSQKTADLNWRVRSITGWLLVAVLILASVYGAGLASTFTVPKYEKSIDTIQDLVDRKLEWGATHDAWIYSLTSSNEPLIKELVRQFRIYPIEELKRRSFTRSMGFGIEKLPGGNFAIGDYITKEALVDMSLMLEDFYFGHCVATMRKSSPYTEKMSVLIGRLQQSGLLLAWETQVALKSLNYEVQQKVKLSRLKKDIGGIKPLKIQNVVGVFIFYVIGIALSILLFLTEKYSKIVDRIHKI